MEDKKNRIEEEISKPSEWFRSVVKEENVSPYFNWHVDKEAIFNGYNKRFNVYYSLNGDVTELPLDQQPACEHIGRLSHQVMYLPNGKQIVPIRQFCETRILQPGTDETFFYDFHTVVSYRDVCEGTEPITTPQPQIHSAKSRAAISGTKITVGFPQYQQSSIDIVASANRAFALEGVHDETAQVLQTFNDDSETPYPDRKPKGGGSKVGRWLDGDGNQITNDIDNIKPLSIKALLKAKEIIVDAGLDTSNLVLYTSRKGEHDLIMDPDIDRYLGFHKPAIITLDTIQRIIGITIIRTDKCPKSQGRSVPKKESIWRKIKRVILRRKQEYVNLDGDGTRSILFVPNITFGLVSSRDITMEASRRNEFQAIHVTGIKKSAAVVKILEGAVRISHR